MIAYHASDGDNRSQLDFYFEHAPLDKYGGYYLHFDKDKPGVVDYMTKSLCMRLGYTQEEVMGMLHGEITRFVYPPDLELYRRFIFEVAASTDVKSLVYRMSRKDGYFIYVIDTMRPVRQGEETLIFSSVVDISEYRVLNMQEQIARCVDIFSKSYDQILFLDSRRQIVQLLYGELNASADGTVELSLSMRATIERWIGRHAHPDEHERLLEFLAPVLGDPSGVRVALESSRTITFANGTDAGDGLPGTSEATLLHMGEGVCLLCHRDVTTSVYAELYREQNERFRNAQDYYHSLLEFVVDGLLAYRDIDDGLCEMLVSERAAETYFGLPALDIESGRSLTISQAQLVEGSALTSNEFKELLVTGSVSLGSAEGIAPREHATLSHAYDSRTGIHWISIMRLEKSPVGERLITDGVMTVSSHRDVYIRTFGHFEVFVDGAPVPFRHEKSKELLALLVDRRGGYVTSRDAISYLWENEPANKVTLARFRKVAMRLRNILEEHGIGDIVEISQRNRRINPDKVRCDLFDYLWGGPDYAQSFKGTYLSDYSWSEFTLMELSGDRHAALFENEF
ncbi:MAG: PAS domain S-box protein [Coriobacteriales bacterium]|jgi:PAS domain S-box-containing protein